MPKWYLVQAFEIGEGAGAQPPGIWGPTDPRPTPPIALPPGYPGSPPGIWGPPGPWPTPPIHLPPGVGSGNPPGIWGPPGPWPTPPIYWPGFPSLPGGSPPGIWGGAGQPFPTPPIFIPQPPLGIWGPPQMPPGFWGGGMGPGVKPQPHPEHPIVIPPGGGAPIPLPPEVWKEFKEKYDFLFGNLPPPPEGPPTAQPV